MLPTPTFAHRPRDGRSRHMNKLITSYLELARTTQPVGAHQPGGLLGPPTGPAWPGAPCE
jgi:hypothetical protein